MIDLSGADHRDTGFAAFGCALRPVVCNNITGKNKPHPSHEEMSERHEQLL
jgi:hypothetical protein